MHYGLAYRLFLLVAANSCFSRANGVGVRIFGRMLQVFGCNFSLSASRNVSSLPEHLCLDGHQLDIIAIKIGGSSLTDKANKETINTEALEWFCQTILDSVFEGFTYTGKQQKQQERQIKAPRKRAFILVHGAGSFGHHTAKEYNLKGKATPPSPEEDTWHQRDNDYFLTRRARMHGLAQTRQSVQTLNRLLVGSLIQKGVNAVAISPCFGIPKLQAHGGSSDVKSNLETVLRDAVQAGLVPVLHGDACLYGAENAGILSGDVLMEFLGEIPWVSSVVFITDVDGVFSSDPRRDPEATLLREVEIDKDTRRVISPVLNVSRSTHDHDVTGGFETKLASAIQIAASTKNVTIARCGSESGEAAIRREDGGQGTVVFSSNLKK